MSEAESREIAQRHEDYPGCACPVIANFLRRWNGDLNDKDRQMLMALIPRLVNSKSTQHVEQKRKQIISDWYFRVNAPTWLEMAGLTAHAAEARGKGAEANWAAARDAAWDASRAASKVAIWDAAWYAAWGECRAATWATAWNAIGAAAGGAARDAARDTAGDAAWDAVGAAARAVAWDAASKNLSPNVIKLQQSALEMINRCLDLKGL